MPAFLKWTIPSLILGMPIVANSVLSIIKNIVRNSVDPDETAHYESSHQDLHCFVRLGLQD